MILLLFFLFVFFANSVGEGLFILMDINPGPRDGGFLKFVGAMFGVVAMGLVVGGAIIYGFARLPITVQMIVVPPMVGIGAVLMYLAGTKMKKNRESKDSKE